MGDGAAVCTCGRTGMNLSREEHAWWQALSAEEQGRIEIGRRVAERVVSDLRRAWDSFVLLEDLFSQITTRRALREMLLSVRPNGLKTINSALFINIVMPIMRATDNPQTDSLSACVISPMLFVDSHVGSLTSEIWLSGRDRHPSTSQEQHQRIVWYRSVVPSGWGSKAQRPEKCDLLRARERFRGIRDRLLAHSGDAGELVQPSMSELKAALDIASQVADAASYLYLRSSAGLGKDNEYAKKAQTRIWDYIDSGARTMKEYGYEE
jgi:hypothetical protein